MVATAEVASAVNSLARKGVDIAQGDRRDGGGEHLYQSFFVVPPASWALRPAETSDRMSSPVPAS